jgi:uncharacterized protein (DUF2384 family)
VPILASWEASPQKPFLISYLEDSGSIWNYMEVWDLLLEVYCSNPHIQQSPAVGSQMLDRQSPKNLATQAPMWTVFWPKPGCFAMPSPVKTVTVV